MARKIIAFVCGLAAWVLVASLLDRLLRVALPGYAVAEPIMAFSLTMQWARLALGALASLSAGFVVARVAPTSKHLPAILGALVLVVFLPVHYSLWNKFPIWYHLVFLLTIVPLVVLGARVGTRKAGQ
jgi:hypothetical protein